MILGTSTEHHMLEPSQPLCCRQGIQIRVSESGLFINLGVLGVSQKSVDDLIVGKLRNCLHSCLVEISTVIKVAQMRC